MAADKSHLYLIEHDQRLIKSWRWKELLPKEYYEYVRCVYNESNQHFKKAILNDKYDEYYEQFNRLVSFPSLISIPHIFAQVRAYALVKKAKQDGLPFIKSQR